eukprot:XP_011665779.1 PREDICTED: uncharacterized protein LOC105439008 [Strongylocentrotus purpuratus]
MEASRHREPRCDRKLSHRAMLQQFKKKTAGSELRIHLNIAEVVTAPPLARGPSIDGSYPTGWNCLMKDCSMNPEASYAELHEVRKENKRPATRRSGRAGGDGEVVQGIFIKHVLESSPAWRTGQLKTGDRILEMEEIEEKAAKLEIMEEDLDKTSRLYNTTQEKTRKEVTQVKSRLQHERNMKLGAFNRVDELQTQVYDYEYAVSNISRPFTSMSFFTSVNRLPPMRSKSSRNSSERPSKSRNSATPAPSTATAGGGLTPNFPPNYRSITPDPYTHQPNNERDRMTQRPKTVGTRLRNRIAEQLMTDLEPDRHETIMQLQAMEQQQNVNTKHKV